MQTSAKKTRIGVFGGTFDPIHAGHLLLAEAACIIAGLDLVLFMPVHIQPFKQDAKISSDDDRIRMIRLAIGNDPYSGIATLECDKGGVSYTIDSLRELKKEYGDADISFLIGVDMFLNIEKWKDSGNLLREFGIIVGVRPGYSTKEAESLADRLRESYGSDIIFIDNPPVELSSTEIRERIKNGIDIGFCVPPIVRIFLMVREKESPERFEHTKRVVDLAVDLAKRYGEDIRKTEIAALLHDYCKDPSGGVRNDIEHADMAMETAKNVFDINDEDILNAIRYHTTGRAGMSRLEKILFLADTVEPGRTYKSITDLRQNCLEDLDGGTLTVLTELKKYLEKNGVDVSEDTEAAIKDLGRR